MVRRKVVDYSTSPLQQSVYIALDPGGKYQRTQTMVACFLHISKSTVADCVKVLRNLDFIRPIRGMKRNIFYKKGKNYRIIEEYINIRKKSERGCDNKNDQVVQLFTKTSDSQIPTLRAHINGGWLSFVVLHEGKMSDVADPNIDGHKWALFGEKKPSSFRGSVNYNTQFSPNKDRPVRIRYQKTDKGNKFLHICPRAEIVVESQLPHDRRDYSIFRNQYVTILSWMEKYAGWKFLKDDHGEYVFSKDNRQSEITTHKRGLQSEYGFDERITSILEDILGRNFGTPGVSLLWEDNSPGAQSNGREMETASPEVARFILDAIREPDAIPNLLRDIEQLKKKIEEMKVIK